MVATTSLHLLCAVILKARRCCAVSGSKSVICSWAGKPEDVKSTLIAASPLPVPVLFWFVGLSPTCNKHHYMHANHKRR